MNSKSILENWKGAKKENFALIFRHSTWHGHKARGAPVWRQVEKWSKERNSERIPIVTHEEEAPNTQGKGMDYEEGAVG